MSFIKTYLEEYRQTYSEFDTMIATDNKQRLSKLCKVLNDEFESEFINNALRKELNNIEDELNVDLINITEDELKKIMNIN
ncbi:hypothetical protein P5618_014970 [Priestia megaterium]|uniref:hypothetical protein n=2 Tax=Priestia megaterium TaxID=1404 RepID=UPI00366C7BF6|nr:hypothetical protein [Priestia megaterium]